MGSIECYIDAKGEVLIVPFAKLPIGHERAIDRPKFLGSSATDSEIGSTVRSALQWCDHRLYVPASPIPHMKATGSRSWQQFSKERRMVSVDFGADSIQLRASKRDKKGAYLFKGDTIAEVALDVSDEELGQAIREMIRHSE